MIPGVRVKIEVKNLNTKYKLNEIFVKDAALKILDFLGRIQNTELEFIFLDDKSIKVLNRKYKKSNRPTDVLSFDLAGGESGTPKVFGEIFISLDRALENSKAFGTKFAEEVVLYVIHGILHLFGYDDENEPDAVRMSRKEQYILERLCRKEDLSKVLTRR